MSNYGVFSPPQFHANVAAGWQYAVLAKWVIGLNAAIWASVKAVVLLAAISIRVGAALIRVAAQTSVERRVLANIVRSERTSLLSFRQINPYKY